MTASVSWTFRFDEIFFFISIFQVTHALVLNKADESCFEKLVEGEDCTGTIHNLRRILINLRTAGKCSFKINLAWSKFSCGHPGRYIAANCRSAFFYPKIVPKQNKNFLTSIWLFHLPERCVKIWPWSQ